ncbi:hypothetical protein VC81_01975 [Levilactobacillus spicheri]|uniref:ABC transporter n=2 Tax=Levilactobacillus spicheri TaxID=216463 RepID=A0A0F3RUL0_9LACO|nr:hypothetical protein VC81_01975 [Levilactobacillus spicheri]
MLSLRIEQDIVDRTIKTSIVSPKYLEDELPEGTWLSLNNSDANIIGQIIGRTSTEVFMGGASFLAAVVYGILTSPILTTIMLVLGLFSIMIPKVAEQSIKRTQKRRQEGQDSNQSLVLQILKTKEIIRIFQAKNTVLKLFNSNYKKFSQSVLENARARYKMTSFSIGIGFIFDVTNLIIMLIFVALGRLSLGQFMGFSVLNNSLMWIFYSFPAYYAQFSNVQVSFERILNYWLKKTEDKQERRLENVTKLIFSDVSFRYKDSNEVTLKNINFNINLKDHEKVVITGISGSGKSTFMNLLIGSLKPTSGKVSFSDDYQDLQEVDNIAFVPQKVQLFTTTLRENILLGRKIGNSRFLEVLHEVGLLDFEKSLNAHQLLSNSNEQATGSVSAGQLQKIGLARALISDSPLLVLDEPTANLDKQSAEDFNRFLSKTKRSVIMITHRNEDIQSYMKHYQIKNKGLEGEKID